MSRPCWPMAPGQQNPRSHGTYRVLTRRIPLPPLLKHPDVEIIVRNRAGAHAEGRTMRHTRRDPGHTSLLITVRIPLPGCTSSCAAAARRLADRHNHQLAVALQRCAHPRKASERAQATPPPLNRARESSPARCALEKVASVADMILSTYPRVWENVGIQLRSQSPVAGPRQLRASDRRLRSTHPRVAAPMPGTVHSGDKSRATGRRG